MRGPFIGCMPLCLLLLSGCSGTAPPEAVGPLPSEPVQDPWGNETRQVLLDVDARTMQFDVLCVFGGGVQMPRADGLVLRGASHVEVLVGVDGASTGIQLGYVLTETPGTDERQQDGIQWLEPVATGERRFTIPVQEGQFESRGGPLLWHFYQRMNVPTGEEQPKAPCYTGVHDGVMRFLAEAVKG